MRVVVVVVGVVNVASSMFGFGDNLFLEGDQCGGPVMFKADVSSTRRCF